MADDARAAQVARIAQLERIRDLESKRQVNGQPSLAAMGNDNGPTAAAGESVGDKATAAVQGFGQGASLGYLPQIQAATEPVLGPIADRIAKLINPKYEPDDTPTTFSQRRDSYLQQLADIQKRNPGTFATGQIAGGLSSALAVPGGAATKGASLANRVMGGTLTGATIGALANPGDKVGDTGDLQLEDRAVNGVTTGAVGGGVPLTTAALAPLAGPLKWLAERQAFKQIGPYARDALKIFSKDKVNSIGRTALDEGVVGGVPTSYGGLQDRAVNAAETTGGDLQNYMGHLDDKAKAIGGDGVTGGINRQAIADQARSELISPHAHLPGVAADNANIEAHIQAYENGSPMMGPLQAWAEKKTLGDRVNWKRMPDADIPLEEQVSRKLYGLKNEAIKDTAAAVENVRPQGVGSQSQSPQAQASSANPIPGNPALGATPEPPLAPSQLKPGAEPPIGPKQLGMPPKSLQPIPSSDVAFPENSVGPATRDVRETEQRLPQIYDWLKSRLTGEGNAGNQGTSVPSGSIPPQGTPGAEKFIAPGRFEELNNRFSNLKTIGDIAGRRDAKTFVNRLISPSDYGVATAGGIIGALAPADGTEGRAEHIATGLALGLGHKMMRQYGYQVTAPLLDKIGNGLNNAQTINPWTVPMIQQSLRSN